MALLSRLFSSRKNNKPQCTLNSDKNERSTWKPFTFGKDQVRVLLFRECDWRGRKLLFDSNAVQKVSLDNSACKLRFTSRQKIDKCKKDAYVEVTNGFGYQYTKPSSDATLLGEMMFGAVAMTFRGTALKVHSMPSPNRVMCTKVFPSPVVMHTSRRTSDRSLEDSYGSSVNSMSEYFSQNSGSESLLESGPLNVPMGEIAGLKPSRYNSLEGDSGFCGDFSLQSISSIGSPSYWTPVASPETRNSFGSLCGNKQSGGSLSSLQRRWIRNMSTSLEFGMSQGDEGPSCTGQHRRTRLGLAVVITLTEEQNSQMEMFLFEHMSVIETMIERLRFSVERAYLRKETFVHLMHEGWTDMQQSLYDMLCTPRLTCPIWLSLTSTENKSHSSLAATFLQDLCLLISTLDTKATNFFVSTLVTGVLTHHLGWVNTVWRASAQNANPIQNSGASESLNDLLKSHPYNPLWAQLGDLYGALGSPTKVAKTIITSNGRKNDCVNKLLSCMTYFIRCGEVKEKQCLKQDIQELPMLTTQLSSVEVSCQKPEIRNLYSKCRRKNEDKEKDCKVLKDHFRKGCLPKHPYSDVHVNLMKKSNIYCEVLHHNNTSSTNVKLNDNVTRVETDLGCSPMPNNSVNSPPNRQTVPCFLSESLESPLAKTADTSSFNDCRSGGHLMDNESSLCILTRTSCNPLESDRLSPCTQIHHKSTSVRSGSSSSDVASHVENGNVKLPDFSKSKNAIDGCKPFYLNSESQCSDVLATIKSTHSRQCSPQASSDVHSVSSLGAGPSGFYVKDSHTHKGLNLKLEILSQKMDQFKDVEQFPTHALRGGNFASPAGAEWETENHLISPSDSGRNSAERELTPDRCDGRAFLSLETVQRGDGEEDDAIVLRGKGGRFGLKHASCKHQTCSISLDEDGGCTKQCSLKRETSDGMTCLDYKGSDVVESRDGTKSELTFDHQKTRFYVGDEENPSEQIRKSAFEGSEDCSGLTSMKRTSSCISKLGDLRNMSMQEIGGSRSSLYPNISELAKMENVQLETDDVYVENLLSQNKCNKSRAFTFETVGDVYDPNVNLKTGTGNVSEAIMDKVSKLCRVPTSAVMFHLESEEEESEFKAIEAECFEMQRLHSERQLTAVDDSHLQWLKNKSMPSFRHLDNRKAGEPDVVFVLGDNEELKGLKNRSASTSVADNITSNSNRCAGLLSDSFEKTSVHNNRLNSESRVVNDDTSSAFVDEPKVIMVKSSYIDLEVESERLKTEISNVISIESVPNELSSLEFNVTSAIPRSLSVSLPVSKHKRPKRPSKLMRRHTEKYCDGCKTILKLKCHSKESVPSEAIGCHQQSFVCCEKCLCPNLRNGKNFGSLGDYELDWSRLHEGSLKHISKSQDHVNSSVRDMRCGVDDDDRGELESSLEADEIKDCRREDNAIFEQYDPSDEEILGSQTEKSEPKMAVSKEIGFDDLHMIELPLPSCESGDFEIVGLASSLLGGVSTRYVPDLVLQGCSMLPPGWEAGLRRDLTLTAKLPLLGQDITEAVCIVANTQTWEVQLVSSHAYVVDKPGTFGVCVGMSQLVANMLESLVHLWKLKMPPENCLLHLESKLQELYLRSQALAELLLTTEFCNMEFLTTSLDLEANDVPLLLAVASTHSPQIAHRYGLSFC